MSGEERIGEERRWETYRALAHSTATLLVSYLEGSEAESIEQ